MLSQDVATMVDAKIRIGRKKLQTAELLCAW
jgi:hypothetical protein